MKKEKEIVTIARPNNFSECRFCQIILREIHVFTNPKHKDPNWLLSPIKADFSCAVDDKNNVLLTITTLHQLHVLSSGKETVVPGGNYEPLKVDCPHFKK